MELSWKGPVSVYAATTILFTTVTRKLIAVVFSGPSPPISGPAIHQEAGWDVRSAWRTRSETMLARVKELLVS